MLQQFSHFGVKLTFLFFISNPLKLLWVKQMMQLLCEEEEEDEALWWFLIGQSDSTLQALNSQSSSVTIWKLLTSSQTRFG